MITWNSLSEEQVKNVLETTSTLKGYKIVNIKDLPSSSSIRYYLQEGYEIQVPPIEELLVCTIDQKSNKSMKTIPIAHIYVQYNHPYLGSGYKWLPIKCFTRYSSDPELEFSVNKELQIIDGASAAELIPAFLEWMSVNAPNGIACEKLITELRENKYIYSISKWVKL